MKTVINLVLGMLLAAAAIGPVAWAAPDQAARTGVSVAAGVLVHATQRASVSTAVRAVLVRTR
jgi:hypothetical protein